MNARTGLAPDPPPPAFLVRLTSARSGWWLIVVALSAVVLLACTGLLTGLVFRQYADAKWFLTVLGPAAALLLFLTKRPVSYLAALVVVVLPFLPVVITFRGFLLPAATPLIAVSVVIAFLVSDRSARGLTRRLGPNRVGRAAMLGAVLLLPGAVRGLEPGLWFLQLVVVAAAGYVICRACQLDPQGAVFVLGAFGGSMALQAVLAIQEFQTHRPFDIYGNAVATGSKYFFDYNGAFRPSGSFYDPISLGNVLSLACPMLLIMACHRAFPLLLRAWFSVCCVLAAGALVLTLSRMSWVGAVAGIAVAVLVSPAGDRVRQVVFLGVASVVVSATAVSLAGDTLAPRFQSIFDPTAVGVRTAGGDEIRQQLWHASFQVFAEHPVFGVGVGNLHAFLVERVGGAGLFGHAHSTYLQNLAEGGVLAGVAILALAYVSALVIYTRLRQSHRHDVIARVCAGALVALAVAWTTDVTIRYTAVLACMTLPFALLIGTRGAGRPGEIPVGHLAMVDLPSREPVGAGRP